jgi:hypothetical protein
MKKYLALLASALFACNALATTLSPISLLNPAGSTSGQVIASTGASTAPAWGNVSISTLTGVLPIANGGTGQTSASGALTALGGLSTTTAASTYLTQTNAASTYGAKTSPLSQFSATTSAQLAGVLSDETGTGSAVFATSPTIASPTVTGTLSAAAVTATGLISPASTVGIKGTVAADEAPAGSWAERPTPTNLSAVSLTTATPANAATVALTAGDWSVQCNAQFLAASSAVPVLYAVGINTTSVTRPAYANETLLQATFPANAAQQIPSPVARFKSGSSFTAYCVTQSSFNPGTMTVSGTISAWRNR